MLGAFLYRKLYLLSGSDVRRKSKTKKVPIYIFGKDCGYRRRIDIGICGALQFSERYIQFLDPTSESGNPKIEKKISRTLLPKDKPCAPLYTATRNLLITLSPYIQDTAPFHTNRAAISEYFIFNITSSTNVIESMGRG